MNTHPTGNENTAVGRYAGQQTDAVPATSTGFAFSLFAAVEIDSSETFPNPPGSSSSKSFGIGERRIPAFAILTFGKASPLSGGFSSQSG